MPGGDVELRKEFEDYRNQQDERWKELIEEQRKLIHAQHENTIALQQLTANTAGVVQLYGDLQGAARVGIALQRFVVWCGKWGVIGTVAAAVVAALIETHGPK